MDLSLCVYILNILSVMTGIKLGKACIKGESKRRAIKLIMVLLLLEHLKMVALNFYGNMIRIYDKVKSKEVSLSELLFEGINLQSY